MSDMPSVLEQHAASAKTEAEMRAMGSTVEAFVQQDYFGFDETFQFMLPDGVSWIRHKALNEGDRRKYLNKVNKEVAIKRLTGDAVMKMQSGDDLHALLESAIVDWNLLRDGQPMPFSKGSLDQFLMKANPKLIDLISKEIHKHNPWLLAEISVEEIDRQISELNEMRETKVKEEAGNVS